MRKLVYLMMAFCATMFTACSDDDKNNIPINGVEIPKFENPVIPGQTVTIKGEGFDEGSEIWFRSLATRTTDNEDVKAEVTGVNANGITFVAPSVYGNQSILLKQDGREYKLGEMLFADQPEEPTDVEILPKRIRKVAEPNKYGFVDEYDYYADGKIKSCYNENDGTYIYTYSGNTITVLNDKKNDKSELFILENGRIKSYSLKAAEWYENYEFEYDKKGYLSKSVMVDDDDDPETETFSFDRGNLVKYTFANKVFKESNGSVEFDYGEQLNNLNIDLFYFIGNYYFDSNISETLLFNLMGKRSRYLPIKMKVTEPEWDEDYENIIGYDTYTVNINYKMNGEYISEFTIEEEGGEWFSTTFTIEYED